MQIDPIPAFRDNYIWCMHDGAQAVVIDPGDAAPVEHFLDAAGLALAAIWITHHHADHTGGVARLRTGHPGVMVAGPAGGGWADLDRPLADGDVIVAFDHEFNLIAVPGHTLDHIAYFAPTPEPPVLFCGDTLFAGGCGRVFEGTHAQMRTSLARLRQLPAATRVYCAHEYTQANLRFAAAVEPDNRALGQRVETVAARRMAEQPSVPSTLAVERATNPFLRWDEPAVVAAAEKRGASSDADVVFSTIRQWKDDF